MLVREVAPSIYRQEPVIPGLAMAFSVDYVREKGDIVIVEPGPAKLVPDIEKGLIELEPAALSYIMPTHIHLDHAGGIGELTARYPQSIVVVNEAAVKHIVDPSRLIRSTRMAFGEDFETVYGAILPVPRARLRVLRDGETLSVGGHSLTAIYTPGHAPHHMAIMDGKTGTLFCGEALGLIYAPGAPPLPAVSPPNFDLAVYLEGMERLRQLRPKLLLYSHGGLGTEPDRLISEAEADTRAFGEAVLGAMGGGASDEEVIARVGQFVQGRWGFTLDEYELASNVHGFLHYYRRKKMG